MLLPRLPRADHVQCAVRDDAMKPGAEVGLGSEAAQVPIRLEQALLNDVFGILLMAGHSLGEAEGAEDVALVEHAKGFAVSFAGATEDARDVAGGHLERLDEPPRRLVSSVLHYRQPVGCWR